MTQIISQRFYTLDLNNQTFQRKFLEELAFTLPGPEGRNGDFVYVCLCMVCLSDIWAWTRTRKCPQERQMIFSHGQFCMTPLRRKKVLEQTVYCTLSQVMCSVNDITLCYGTGCCGICGAHWESPRKPSGCRNPPHYYFQLIFLSSKQSAYVSYNYTSCRSKSGVSWGKSVLWCMSDLVVFSVALPSLGPLEDSLWNGSNWPWPMTVT